MNEDTDVKKDIDAALSASYRSIADEKAPARLNRTVLQKAARAVNSGSAGSWRDTWYRPVVFAATLVLSLALILQLADTGPSVPLSDHDVTTDDVLVTPPSADALLEAASVAEQQLRDAQNRADASMMDTPPVSPPAVAADTTQAAAESLLPDNQRCTDEERTQTGTWWACIELLEKQGLTESAEQELQALLAAFPAFIVPN